MLTVISISLRFPSHEPPPTPDHPGCVFSSFPAPTQPTTASTSRDDSLVACFCLHRPPYPNDARPSTGACTAFPLRNIPSVSYFLVFLLFFCTNSIVLDLS